MSLSISGSAIATLMAFAADEKTRAGEQSRCARKGDPQGRNGGWLDRAHLRDDEVDHCVIKATSLH